jgi:hypothetical protein
MRNQKGRSFYGEKYGAEKEKYLDRTYTAVNQNARRK